ncbi:hypothetical protein D806_034450 [Mycolicibacterium smegmatis MKD8]|uniref:Uncharacterized protein n=1 Tax=Mycolicibacterium smegmatis (strain MKD8) TaxID=1214915 RepID=A0A2U9PRL2_MYCSE|nr:hypothetical protein D806_034450 [Mycolicibacterium smegmatis MKD8]
MVLEVCADPGQVMDDVDAHVAKVRLWAHTGHHQKLRGTDRAGRQHNLANRPHTG